jgi:rod shape-determining protein MreB
MCCPSEVTKIERDIMIQLANNMGMKDTFIEEEIKSGALGAGVDIFKSRGTMIVDIGGGTTDVGVLSFGDIVLSRTIRMAGSFIDTEIIKYVKKKEKVEIGELTSEQCKIQLSDLREGAPSVSNRYAGRDIVRGVPKYVDITSEDISSVIVPVYEEIVKLITAVLKDTPPELSADIYQNGILLTGGGALVRGIEEYISKRVLVPVRVASNPLTCVAEGAKFLLKNRGDYLVNPLQL